MKKLAWLTARVMAVSCMTIPAMAETAAPVKESASGFFYIEADEATGQAQLSAVNKDMFIQADGLYFKDLNKNGALDVYEDYRQDVTARVNDLLGQMTMEEKAGTLGFGGIGGKNGITVSNLSGDSLSTGQTGVSFIQVDSEQMSNDTDTLITVDEVTYTPVAYQIKKMNLTTMIAAMTGNPKDQLDTLNKIQSIAEENRLGIPVVFSGDRTYNTWGGMIDAAHYALGVAHDEDLLYNLLSEYAKESVALGYHQVFHGYGNEIGSWYGDDPAYIAAMAAKETRAYEDNGFNSHSKHFIARGGRNPYGTARSEADLIDSWLVGWKSVVDAGTQWVMTNNNVGRTGGLYTVFDRTTYSILRDDLGYTGIICLDWPLGADRINALTGATVDGVDVTTLSIEEKYALILNVGIDMFSCYGATPGTDLTSYAELTNNFYPEIVIATVNDGLVTEEDFNTHVSRVLKNKFDQKLFEDPYSDWEAAAALIANEQYLADGMPIVLSTSEIDNYRRSEIKEMEEKLMVESTVMLKNDSILPLASGTKVHLFSNNGSIQEEEAAALAEKLTVVDELADADVALIHVTTFDDAYELAVEDAQDAGKPIILIFEGTIGRNGAQGDPYFDQVSTAAAVLVQTYSNTPDHGSSVGSFYRYVTPSVTVAMLMGEKDPNGSTVFEVPYSVSDLVLSNYELQNDVGTDAKTRLYMTMMAKENPVSVPNNMGDVMYTTNFGMSYAAASDIQLSLLSMEQDYTVEAYVDARGRDATRNIITNKAQKAGVPFEISFVATNDGGDGTINVQVLDGETVVAEKFLGVDAGQWRVVTMELTLEAGEHVITVGDMTTTIIVE